MTKKDFLGIAYVSIWVLLWGSVGSIIDFALLQKNIYQAGSIGQITTFTLTAILSIALGVILFPKFMQQFNSD